MTHQIQFLKKASKILVLNEGKQVAFGTYDDIINSGINLSSFLQKPEKPTAEKPTLESQDSIRRIPFVRTMSVLSTQSEVSMT